MRIKLRVKKKSSDMESPHLALKFIWNVSDISCLSLNSVARFYWRCGVSEYVFRNLDAILIAVYLGQHKMFARIERFLAINESHRLEGGRIRLIFLQPG